MNHGTLLSPARAPLTAMRDGLEPRLPPSHRFPSGERCKTPTPLFPLQAPTKYPLLPMRFKPGQNSIRVCPPGSNRQSNIMNWAPLSKLQDSLLD